MHTVWAHLCVGVCAHLSVHMWVGMLVCVCIPIYAHVSVKVEFSRKRYATRLLKLGNSRIHKSLSGLTAS